MSTRVLHKSHILPSIFSIAALLLFSGCSDLSPFGPPSTNGYPNISGNWGVSAASNASASPTSYYLGGSLQDNQGALTGLLRVVGVLSNSSTCLNTGTVLSFTGSLQKNGAFTVSSNSISGEVITLTGSFGSSSDPSSTVNSTYGITGSCQDQGGILAEASPVPNGSYTGSTQPGSDASAVTAVLSGSPTVNSSGEFPLSGSLTFQGSSCLSSVTMDPAASYVSGAGISGQLKGMDKNGEAATVELNGNYTNSAVYIDYSVTGGSCAGDQGSAILAP